MERAPFTAIMTQVIRRQRVNPEDLPTCRKCSALIVCTDMTPMGYPGVFLGTKDCPECIEADDKAQGLKDAYESFYKRANDLPVPLDWMAVKLGDLKPTIDIQAHRETVMDYLREWPENRLKGIGLTIQSETTGNGKSTLARAIATFLRQRKVRVLMMRSERFRQVMADRNGRHEAESILSNCDLFILDDIGTEKTTADGLIAFSELVEDFNLKKRPLIITKNESFEVMQEAYKKVDSRAEMRWLRIGDRVRERSINLTFLGPSLRKNLGGNA